MSRPTPLLSYFSAHPIFGEAPLKSIQWLAEKGGIVDVPANTPFVKMGENWENMVVVLSGGLEMNSDNFQKLFKTNDVTGRLPYDQYARNHWELHTTEDSVLYLLSQAHFPELIRDHYELTQILVHLQMSKVSDFEEVLQRIERQLTLGKLSIGIAQELSKPSSAMVSDSSELRKQLFYSFISLKALLQQQLSEREIEGIAHQLSQKFHIELPEWSYMEKQALSEEMADWLEAHGESNGFDYAEYLVDFGYSTQDMEELYQISGNNLTGILSWLIDELKVIQLTDKLKQSSKRIGALVTGVKRYANSDELNETQVVNISEGIDTSLTLLAHKIKENKIRIERHLPEDLPQIQGVPSSLNRLWTNILDNAINAMEENGGTLTISSSVQKSRVHVLIRDTGSGVDNRDLNHIFNPFYSIPSKGAGLGIGLGVAKRILHEHNAEIEISSQPGNTCCTLSFARA